MAKKGWFLTKTASDEWLAAAVTGKQCHPSCSSIQKGLPPLVDCTAKVSLASQQLLVLVADFPLTGKEILAMQIRNRVAKMALFDEGTEIVFCSKQLRTRGSRQQLAIVVMPAAIVEKSLKELSIKTEITILVPAVVSIASLIAQVCTDPLLLLLAIDEGVEIMIIANSMPLYYQLLPMMEAGQVDSTILSHGVDVAMRTMARDFEIKPEKIILFGSNREMIDPAELGLSEYIPDFSHCLEVESSALLNFPALFGTPFVPPSISLLPNNYKLAWKIQGIATFTSWGLAAAAIVLTVLAALNYHDNLTLKSHLASETACLTDNITALKERLPPASKIENLQIHLKQNKQAALEPRLSLLINEIAKALPNEVFIRELTINRQAKQADHLAAQHDTDYSAFDIKPRTDFVVHLACESLGSFAQVKARFDQAAAALADGFHLRQISWNYSEQNKTGTFVVELLPVTQQEETRSQGST